MFKRILRHKVHLLFFSLVILMTVLAFRPFFFEGKIPLPGDILLGGYHPWMDQRWDNRSTIYPVLNNEISDAMTSLYPWRYKAITLAKQGVFPLLNESSYMGYPLFATGLTGLFYPLSSLFLLLSFNFVWSLLVASTPLLGALFFYLWLKDKELHPIALILSSLTYAFSAFLSLQVTFVSTTHSVVWLPLILFSTDRLISAFRLRYFLLLIFATVSSLNSGFFQGSLYTLAFSFAYLLFRSWQERKLKQVLPIGLAFIFGVALSAIQILPFLELVSQSSRSLNYGHSALLTQTFNFFVEYKYLLTTLIPDFFGNPGKWNYWGKPNFYEFNNYSGYLSIIGLAVILITPQLRRKLAFFLGALLLTLIIATPNPISQFPYFQNWPILSSLTPSRLLAITQFCLITIGAFGLSEIFHRRVSFRKLLILGGSFSILYIGVAALAFLSSNNLLALFPDILPNQWNIAFRNTAYSGIIITASLLLILLLSKTKYRVFFLALLVLTVFDLLRQSQYHRPFIKEELLYPKENTVTYLQQNSSGYRFSITHPDLLPSNLQDVYDLRAVDGVGPLFPDRYNQFIASANAEKLTDSLPRFPRTLFYESPRQPFVSLFNVKYILSLKELEDPSFKEVKRENQTLIYENTKVLPKAWIVKWTSLIRDPLETMKYLRSANFNPGLEAILENETDLRFSAATPRIVKSVIGEGKASFETEGDGILVFSEQFLPGWRSYIDGKEVKIQRVNFDLIGLIIPPGNHQVDLKYEPASFLLGKRISLITLIALFALTLFYLLKRQAARDG